MSTRCLWLLPALLLAATPPARAQAPLLELVTDQVEQPIHIASAGDARLFVVSRPGSIRVVQDGAVLPTPFLDINGSVADGGEGGLLSIAFHPDYATNGFAFVSYTDNELDSVVARYTRSATDPNTLDPDTAHVVIEVDQSSDPGFQNHRGGQIQFGPDGYLYFGLGDGGSSNDPFCHAQDPGSLLGKMLRLDVSNDTYTIWASGLRNPWRFSFDRETGDLWIGDVGQNLREEIDFQPASSGGGENYGWKVMEGSECGAGGASNCAAATPPCNDPSYTAPVFEYDSAAGSRAITGGYVYRGPSAPKFRGRYVFGDSSTGEIWALDGAPGSFSAELIASVSSPVSFGEDATGELYVASLFTNSVYRLRLDDPAPCVNGANARVAKYAAAAEKDVRACVSLAARGKLGGQSLDACTLDDRKGALGRQQAALEKLEDARCVPAPEFGFAGSAAAGAAAAAAGRELAQLAFGEDLDAAIATNAADRVTAKCQAAVLKGLGACQAARRKELLRCKKAGLAAGSIDSAETLAACLATDPNGRVAKACDPGTGKLAARTLPVKCAARGVDLAEAFPGCDESAVGALAFCLDAAGRCAHCRTFDAADGLGVDCDAICEDLP